MGVTQYETVALKRYCQTMCGRACETGRGNQLTQCCRTRLQGIKNSNRLVQNADSRMNGFAFVLGTLDGSGTFDGSGTLGGD